MNSELEKFCAFLSGCYDFPFYCYIFEQGAFYSIYKGVISETARPAYLEGTIMGREKDVYLFKKNNKVVIFYIFRNKICEKDVVFIMPALFGTKGLSNFIENVLKNVFNLYVSSISKVGAATLSSNNVNQSEIIKDNAFSDEDTAHDKLETGSIERDIYKKMMNGFNVPLFAVNKSYEIVRANSMLLGFVNVTDDEEIRYKKCYDLIFGFDEPCPWCKLNYVIDEKKQYVQNVEHIMNGKEFVFEQLLYSLPGDGSTVDTAGEMLYDITEYVQVLESLKKSDEQVKIVSKMRINDIKEMGELKKEYENLHNEYDKTSNFADKLSTLLKRLLEMNNVKELIALKSKMQKMETQNRLLQRTFLNYKTKMENYDEKISDLNQKSVYGIERMINIINNRKDVDKEEMESVINFILGQIEIIKTNLIKEEENVG